MANVLTFPFAVDNNGVVLTVDSESDECYAQELALLVLTNTGERELVPDYGTNDPAFASFDEVDFLSQVELFGPPVIIKSINTRFTNDSQQTVDIEFDSFDKLADSDFIPDEEVALLSDEEGL